MLGPLEQSIWLHLGARFPEHGSQLANMVGGAVITAAKPGKKGTAALRYARARELTKSEIPTMLQHHGLVAEETTLYGAHAEWIEGQANLALVSSPTAYVCDPVEGGSEDLRRGVRLAKGFLAVAAMETPGQPRLALFALHHRWLRAGHRDQLIAALGTLDGPIGLMLHSSQDPLASVRQVEGLVDVVRRLPQVVILRCDYGALGAYAFGAAGGSIGLNPTCRHFIPDGASSFADLSDPTPRVFLRSLMSYHKGSRLAAYEGKSNFDCIDDRVCHGRPLSRFQDERLSAEADAHSVSSWSLMALQLSKLEGRAREDEWIRWCRIASANLDYLDDHNEIVENPSAQLKAWLRFAGVPIP